MFEGEGDKKKKVYPACPMYVAKKKNTTKHRHTLFRKSVRQLLYILSSSCVQSHNL